MNCNQCQLSIANRTDTNSPEFLNHIADCAACQGFRSETADIDRLLKDWRDRAVPDSLYSHLSLAGNRRKSPLLPVALTLAVATGLALGIRTRSVHTPVQLRKSLTVKEAVSSVHEFEYKLDDATGKLAVGQMWIVEDLARLDNFSGDRTLRGPFGVVQFIHATRKVLTDPNPEPKNMKLSPTNLLPLNALFPDESQIPAENRRFLPLPKDPDKIEESIDRVGEVLCRRFDYTDRADKKEVLWIDAKTNLTVRREFMQADGKSIRLAFDFVWNERLAPSVFASKGLKLPLTTCADPYPFDPRQFSLPSSVSVPDTQVNNQIRP
jgi:hypothetical protein